MSEEIISKAKEVAQKQVLSRVVTIQEAKESYKQWIKYNLSKVSLSPEIVEFWQEVYNHVDSVEAPKYPESFTLKTTTHNDQ